MMADDGIGHEVVRRLDQCGLPNSVRILAFDEDVLALTQLWKGEQAVWFVDAVSGDLPAGTLRVYDHQDLLQLPADGFTTHHTNMSENLRWMLHGQPEMAAIEFRLYGIEAGVIRPERGLSRAVEGGVNRLVDGLRRAARDLTSTSSDSLRRRQAVPIFSDRQRVNHEHS